jgi:alkanesulfonate monooxygenase SsuD/methylene tetrahydromethanopterin reductase-like flavin-dependent oxidoreductase (luciferase family)
MDIGIGLPNTVLGVDRRGIVDWSRRAEQAGFASLGTIDRIAYDNYESLTSLAAAAAVTERVRLTTDILIAPLRPAGLLAKQAATINDISQGRLVLGMAVGGREDDFGAVEADFHSRGKTFDLQLETMTQLWSGDGEFAFGPTSRPSMLIGGSADVAYARAARWADGWTQGGGTPEMFTEGKAKLERAWQAEGRAGKPRTMVLFYYALGDGAKEAAQDSLGAYYSFLGEYAQQVVDSAATDADTLKGYLAAFEEAGADEVICFPASADPAQVELLAEAALTG